MKGIIHINVKKCVACRTCELACAVEHSGSKELCKAIAESPRPKPRVKVEVSCGLSAPLQCRQCQDAPCVKVCPSKALARDDRDKPVVFDKALCIGCTWCVVVCPFGVIRMDDEGKGVIKCDMCIERLAKNKPPACVEACPTAALQFKPQEEMSQKKRKDFMTVFSKDEKEL